MPNPKFGFHIMADNEGSSGEGSLEGDDTGSGFSSVEESFSTSEFSSICIFYTWYVLKGKKSYKSFVLYKDIFIFFILLYSIIKVEI